MRIVSIDPGQTHLGLCFADLDDSRDLHVDFCACVDLKAYGQGHLVDKFKNFITSESKHFENCDVFVMERQPPIGGGGEAVSCLFYSLFRDKTVLIHPSTLHKHFGLGGTTYEDRKALVCELASPALSHLPAYMNFPRKHDMADAYLLLRCYIDRTHPKPKVYKHFSEYAYRPSEDLTKKSRFF